MGEINRQWYVEVAEFLSAGCFWAPLTGNDAERYIAATTKGRAMLAEKVLGFPVEIEESVHD